MSRFRITLLLFATLISLGVNAQDFGSEWSSVFDIPWVNDWSGNDVPDLGDEGIEEGAMKEIVDDVTARGGDTIFMGETAAEEDGFEIELDSLEYQEALRKLFIEPITKLGAKPLRLTLEDCIRIALVNNNRIQAAEYSVDSARARYEEASARFWPIFEYEWLTAPVPSDVSDALGSFFRGDLAWWHKIRVAMGLPLYSFGKLNIAKSLALGGISAAREGRKKERLSTVTQVRQLYYGVLLAEELGQLLVKAHRKLSRAIENDEKNGKSPLDKIRGNVFLVDVEKRLADTRDKEALALEGLRVQLGLNPDVAVMVYSDQLHPVKTSLRPFNDYMEIALSRRPDVKLVEIGLEARRKQYTLEKRKFLPDIGIGAYIELGRTIGTVTGITTTDDFSDPLNFSRAGVGLRVEGKFDVHGQYSRVKKARSDYYQASLEHYMAKDGIGLEVQKAHMEAVTALDNVRRANKAQRLARQLMFLTQSNYELGVGEREEYTDALELVMYTRGKYFEAVFQYNVALAILDEKAGIIPDVSSR